jgi:hypothetical protein
MARTANDTLNLSMDDVGLRTEAWLNPKRQDVSDLVLAIEDRDITEMSFAFMLDEGWWSDDFETFKITKVSLDRGDVSAVNYGANPFTSIAARQQEILTDLRLAGPGVARAALAELMQRADFELDDLAHRYDELRRPEREKEQDEAAKGRSLAQVEAMLQD